VVQIKSRESAIVEFPCYSGSVLSKDKCQIIQIFYKYNFMGKIITGPTNIPTISGTVEILCLTICHKFKWHSHIPRHKSNLGNPLGIGKHLSSVKYNTNSPSLIEIIKPIIINKIDYCLSIYGHADKFHLNQLKTTLNSIQYGDNI